MIKSLSLVDVTPYGQRAILSPLKRLNIVYGPNGSGKTTISRVLAEPGKYPQCETDKAQGTEPQIEVYNRDFVEQNFVQSDEFPGVFTVGSEDKNLLRQLSEARAEFQDVSARLQTNRGILNDAGGVLEQLKSLDNKLADDCWKVKGEHEVIFGKAFAGLNASKARLRDHLLEQAKTNAEDLESLDTLTKKAQTLFSGEMNVVAPIERPELNTLPTAHENPILRKKIIGRADLDISGLIDHLGNSDWVRVGLGLTKESGGKCPFCQQSLLSGFTEKLAAYFDGSFEANRKIVDRFAEEYSKEYDKLLSWITGLIEQSGRKGSFLQPEPLIAATKAIKARASDQQSRIERKRGELATIVSLQPIADELQDLWKIIDEANKAINDHNGLVKNRQVESDSLKKKFWKFLVSDALKAEFAEYRVRREQLIETRDKITLSVQADDERSRLLAESISQLEGRTSSSSPTIERINKTLRDVGFSRFLINSSKGGTAYHLVRPDGSSAKHLSEGEKTLVTFLYFLHRVRNDSTVIEVASDRVVVIDDPISSLDSEVLFVVSTLVRALCEDVFEKRGVVKQVILLTHNIYFFKEVTFPSRVMKKAMKEMTYWTISKTALGSEVLSHNKNPIKSSYDLLWQELRGKPIAASSVTIQNCARRILEHFGSFIGGKDVGDLCQYFPEDEQHMCRAMMSWLHDGSHSSGNELYVSLDERTTETFLRVFRAVFEKLGCLAHYEQMMSDT